MIAIPDTQQCRQHELPHELEELILEHLRHDPACLKTSSLVCHCFAHTTKKFIFSTIVLEFSNYGDPQTQPRRFMELLISSSPIFGLVQNLTIVDNRYKFGRPTHLRFDTILPTSLPLLWNLKRIAVESMSLTSLMWTAMTQDVQSALENAFRSPSVVSISFYRILDLPVALFSGCAALQSLSLKLISFRKEDMVKADDIQQPIAGITPESVKRPQLVSLLLMLSGPLFHFFAAWATSPASTLDISAVQRLSVSMKMEYYDYGSVRILLEAAASTLEIFCFSPVFGDTIAINPIDVGSLCRLRVGMIQTHFSHAHGDFSPWILKTVSQLNSKNMQEISIKISFPMHKGRLNLNLSGWSALDSVVLETCPTLRRFTIFLIQCEIGLQEGVLSDIRNHLISLAEHGILNIEVASSRMGFFGLEISGVSPSDDII